MDRNETERRVANSPIPLGIQERFPVDLKPNTATLVRPDYQLLGFQQDWEGFLASPQVSPIVDALATHPVRVAQVSTDVITLRERLHVLTDERKGARQALREVNQERRNIGFIDRIIRRIPFIKSEEINPATLKQEKKALGTQIKETEGQLQAAIRAGALGEKV